MLFKSGSVAMIGCYSEFYNYNYTGLRCLYLTTQLETGNFVWQWNHSQKQLSISGS